MQLNPPPVRDGLYVGDHVVAIGLHSRVHGVGKIAAIRTVKGVSLFAVKFASSHKAEFTEKQLRKKVSA